MKKTLIVLLSVLGLSACKSTPSTTSGEPFDNLLLQEAVLQTSAWQPLQRIAPRYPIDAATSGKEGCATIEYVIMPDYQIHIMKIADSAGRIFEREAQLVIQRWNWQQLPAGLITEPVKTRTRFEFCLESEAGQCSAENLAARSQCSGTDVLPSVGYRIQ
ncbi:energy transducer TonB [Arsukibacterium sp.]|uniref:energy transducer TonB n=1 Tax=Arsukibacterium sp. TaxID=1977258 RepID=UPI002FDA43E6